MIWYYIILYYIILLLYYIILYYIVLYYIFSYYTLIMPKSFCSDYIVLGVESANCISHLVG